MKTNSIYRSGFAALALVLTLTACADLAGPETGSGAIPAGMGLARIRLGVGGPSPSVRTALPDLGEYYFTLQFTAPEKNDVNQVLSGGTSVTVALDPVVWTLEVKGYADAARTSLKVKGSRSVSVIEGTETNFDVYMSAVLSSGGNGTLSYNITLPIEVSRAWFGLYPIDDLCPLDDTPVTSEEIDISEPIDRTGALTDIPEGSYRAVIDLYDGGSNKAAVWTGAVHIDGGLTTALTRSFTTADCAECPPPSTVTPVANTLSDKLDAALADISGSYTIVLDGTEGDLGSFSPKTLNVTGKDISITIRGNGHEVQLDSSGGTLFTLGAASGSSLSLAIQDLTLKGVSSNTGPVVKVEDGGTLRMKTGSRITGNECSYPAGVYVQHGYSGSVSANLIMSGGSVSGNTGSGVILETGSGNSANFIMTGGAVSDNTSSSFGAGVYVSNGTFTMSGGAVSGNTNTGDGGGVGLAGSSASFEMSGGAVSGNTASYGGGVSSGGGSPTFTMSGGVVSGNTASSGGGGLAGNAGIFTISGGTVSGNTASIGGGVRVNATLNMSGGTVTGNTADFSGGGVYVYNGSFNMSGGAVTGNILTDPDGGYGREVLYSTVSTGKFRISGDARPERVFLFNGLSITINGPLSGGTVPVDLELNDAMSIALTDWVGQPILSLDTTAYPTGDLANLKEHFTLGDAIETGTPYPVTPITGYTIDDGGLFAAE